MIHKGRRKKVLLFMAGPLRPNPPPPSSLMAVKNWNVEKKGSNPTPPPLNSPAIKRKTVFCGFPK